MSEKEMIEEISMIQQALTKIMAILENQNKMVQDRHITAMKQRGGLDANV